MKKILLFLFLLSFGTGLKAQSMYFPPLAGTTWDTISPTSLGWCPDKIDTLLNYLEDRNSKAFIVLVDGKIVIEKYFGSFTMDSVWYWASAGKSLTAFTVGIAQQEGYLSISDTTSEYLGTGWTVCPAPKEDMITIRHQLTMTTGLDDGVADYTCTDSICLQYLADAGTRWAYHNGPYTLLDGVIQNSTGMSLNTYVAQKVAIPTGMTGIYLPQGYNNVYFSKPRSMARFGLLVLNKGNWNGNQIMTDTTYFNQMVNTSQSLNPSYGYLWWLNGKSSYMVPGLQTVFPGSLNPNAPADMFAAMGKNGQMINVVPSMNLVFIRMGNAPGVGLAVPATFNDTIWQHLNDIMCTTSVPQNDPEFFHVFPNPSKNIFQVQLSKPGDFKMVVTNTLGEVLFVSNITDKSTVDMSSFSNGMYYISLYNSQSTYTCKILKTE